MFQIKSIFCPHKQSAIYMYICNFYSKPKRSNSGAFSLARIPLLLSLLFCSLFVLLPLHIYLSTSIHIYTHLHTSAHLPHTYDQHTNTYTYRGHEIRRKLVESSPELHQQREVCNIYYSICVGVWSAFLLYISICLLVLDLPSVCLSSACRMFRFCRVVVFCLYVCKQCLRLCSVAMSMSSRNIFSLL